MIKCPKCQFEQPEDIYCAQCGVNMKNFVPPKKSILVSLLSNQSLIVGLLFIGIIAFVVYDYALSKKPKTTTVAAVTKQTSAQIDVPYGENPSTYQPSVQQPAQQQAAVAAPDSIGDKPGEKPMAEKLASEKAALEAPRPARAAAEPAVGVPKSLQISFYQVSRALLSELQRETNASSFNGDGFGGVIAKRRLLALRKNPEFKAISTNRYKLDGHPISIFKGQKSGESAKSIGLYFQINPLKNDPAGTQIEVKSWGSLKIQENDENLFSGEMTLNPQYAAMIAGFLPKDKVFGDEEKAIFDSDRSLKIYNTEGFWDGDIDLIMFVELAE
jgi:hypothetical protein